jgi:hypothetical protein
VTALKTVVLAVIAATLAIGVAACGTQATAPGSAVATPPAVVTTDPLVAAAVRQMDHSRTLIMKAVAAGESGSVDAYAHDLRAATTALGAALPDLQAAGDSAQRQAAAVYGVDLGRAIVAFSSAGQDVLAGDGAGATAKVKAAGKWLVRSVKDRAAYEAACGAATA